MAMGPEAKLWKALKPHLDANSCLSTRIENRHGGGLPDIDVVSPVGGFKIELKVAQSFSVRISDMQIAYNTLLNCKHGLSFILAEVPGRSELNRTVQLFEDQGPRSEEVGSGQSGRGRGNRVGSGRGPRTSVGSGRGPRYRVWHGRDAVQVGRDGLRAEALWSGDSLSDAVGVMLGACEAHHARLLEKAQRG